MNRLFNVNIIETPEVRMKKFVSKLIENGVITANKEYVDNYISGSASVVISHIKISYNKCVIERGWTEKKFEEITYAIIRFKRILTEKNYIKYSEVYDEGKLRGQIYKEIKRYQAFNR